MGANPSMMPPTMINPAQPIVPGTGFDAMNFNAKADAKNEESEEAKLEKKKKLEAERKKKEEEEKAKQVAIVISFLFRAIIAKICYFHPVS